MEITNLLNKDFKTKVINMLTDLQIRSHSQDRHAHEFGKWGHYSTH